MKLPNLIPSYNSRYATNLIFSILIITTSITGFAAAEKKDSGPAGPDFTVNIPIHMTNIPEDMSFTLRCAVTCRGNQENIWDGNNTHIHAKTAAYSDPIILRPDQNGEINTTQAVPISITDNNRDRRQENVDGFICSVLFSASNMPNVTLTDGLFDPTKDAVIGADTSRFILEYPQGGIELLPKNLTVRGEIKNKWNPVSPSGGYDNCTDNPSDGYSDNGGQRTYR